MADLTAGVAERIEITVGEIVTNLRESRDLAHEHKQVSAAVQAESAVAKVSGHWVGSHKDVTDAPPLNEAEVAKMMAHNDPISVYLLEQAFKGNSRPLHELNELMVRASK